MTNKEAIEILGGDFSNIDIINKSPMDAYHEAFRIAIKALENFPVVEMPIDQMVKTTEQYMEEIRKKVCLGCAFLNDREDWEEPCNKCQRACKDYYRKSASKEKNEI